MGVGGVNGSVKQHTCLLASSPDFTKSIDYYLINQHSSCTLLDLPQAYMYVYTCTKLRL